MYASAIIKKLTSNPETQITLRDESDDSSEEDTEEQAIEKDGSYAEFFETTYDALLELDRRRYEHELSFRTQDDGWSDYWHLRTGIALQELSARWESLEEWGPDPTLHPGDFINRDPTIPQEIRKEFLYFLEMHRKEETAKIKSSKWEEARDVVLGKRDAVHLSKIGLSLRLRGSTKSFQSFVVASGRIHLDSKPGNEDAADNHELHGLFGQHNISYARRNHHTANAGESKFAAGIPLRDHQESRRVCGVHGTERAYGAVLPGIQREEMYPRLS